MTFIRLLFLLFLFSECSSWKMRQNRIFLKGKKWVYTSTFSDSAGNLLLTEEIELLTTGKTFNGQTGIIWKYSPFDLEMYPVLYNPAKLDFSDYQQGEIEVTGVIEKYRGKNQEVWMHPPRSLNYIITELCPFPSMNYPIQQGQKWTSGISGLGGYGDWDGYSIVSKYEVKGIEKIKNVLGEIDCWLIETKSKSPLGIAQCDFYFNEKYGFVQMNYHFFDKNSLTLKLSSHSIE